MLFGITLNCSSTIFIEAVPLSQTQILLIQVVLLANLLWVSTVITSKVEITGGLRCQLNILHESSWISEFQPSCFQGKNITTEPSSQPLHYSFLRRGCPLFKLYLVFHLTLIMNTFFCSVSNRPSALSVLGKFTKLYPQHCLIFLFSSLTSRKLSLKSSVKFYREDLWH